MEKKQRTEYGGGPLPLPVDAWEQTLEFYRWSDLALARRTSSTWKAQIDSYLLAQRANIDSDSIASLCRRHTDCKNRKEVSNPLTDKYKLDCARYCLNAVRLDLLDIVKQMHHVMHALMHEYPAMTDMTVFVKAGNRFGREVSIPLAAQRKDGGEIVLFDLQDAGTKVESAITDLVKDFYSDYRQRKTRMEVTWDGTVYLHARPYDALDATDKQAIKDKVKPIFDRLEFQDIPVSDGFSVYTGSRKHYALA